VQGPRALRIWLNPAIRAGAPEDETPSRIAA
jgi:hypothetical protein